MICKIPIKVKKLRAITGDHIAKIRGILSVWPKAKDKFFKLNIPILVIKPIMINLILSDFLRVFMVRTEAKAVMRRRKKVTIMICVNFGLKIFTVTVINYLIIYNKI